MKILYVATIASTINDFFIPHIKFLLDKGNVVGIACNKVHDISPKLLELGCEIHPITFQRNPLDLENVSAYKQIHRVVAEEGYELLHVHTPVASFITRMACRNIQNVKILYTAHGFHFFKGAPMKNWALYYTLEKMAARWTDGLITMNDEDYLSAKKLKLRKEHSIFKVNGIGLDLQKFVPQTFEKKNKLRYQYGFSDEDFILIYVGELSYRKHQDLIIKAVGRLKGSIPNLKLLVVGSGSKSIEYKELTKSLDIERNVAFLGYREDIPQLMALSDIAVSTSRQEGLPVNVMEAMATGLPLVVTNCRGNRDLVIHDLNGYVVDTDDVHGCASSIERLYKSAEIQQRFSTKNKDLIHLYSIEVVINDMNKIYEKQGLQCEERLKLIR
ncbi:glycosyltransferase family 4 protein [Ferdinandcohnia sp. Marseille-Q9671]